MNYGTRSAILATVSTTMIGLAFYAGLSGNQSKVVPTIMPTPSVRVIKGDPTMLQFSDCADLNSSDPVTESQPCITKQGGKWLKITTSAQEVAECAVEDGGPILPCVGKSKDLLNGKFNYFE